MTRDCPGTVIFFAKADMEGEMVRYRSRNVAVDRAVYQVRAQSKGADARQKHRAAYTHWTAEDDARLASEAARGRTVEERARVLDG